MKEFELKYGCNPNQKPAKIYMEKGGDLPIEILNGKRPVTTDFALMMEAALGINPELLINMQSRYNMSVARQKKPLLAKLTDIRRACAAVF